MWSTDMTRSDIFDAISTERERQDMKFGEQNIPILAPDENPANFDKAAQLCKRYCAEAVLDGTISWRHVLMEEVMEVFGATTHDHQVEELIQVAAVAVSMIECLVRNKK
jgi:hypothetical protein